MKYDDLYPLARRFSGLAETYATPEAMGFIRGDADEFPELAILEAGAVLEKHDALTGELQDLVRQVIPIAEGTVAYDLGRLLAIA